MTRIQLMTTENVSTFISAYLPDQRYQRSIRLALNKKTGITNNRISKDANVHKLCGLCALNGEKRFADNQEVMFNPAILGSGPHFASPHVQ